LSCLFQDSEVEVFSLSSANSDGTEEGGASSDAEGEASDLDQVRQGNSCSIVCTSVLQNNEIISVIIFDHFSFVISHGFLHALSQVSLILHNYFTIWNTMCCEALLLFIFLQIAK